MLRRFSRLNRARGRISAMIDNVDALPSDWKVLQKQ